jgi:hypothetical protein
MITHCPFEQLAFIADGKSSHGTIELHLLGGRIPPLLLPENPLLLKVPLLPPLLLKLPLLPPPLLFSSDV